MLLPNLKFMYNEGLDGLNFKTSYVTTKLHYRWVYIRTGRISKHPMLLPNISFQFMLRLWTFISKHHMLLPNNIPRVAICSKNNFKTSYVKSKLPVFLINSSFSAHSQNFRLVKFLLSFYQIFKIQDFHRRILLTK